MQFTHGSGNARREPWSTPFDRGVPGTRTAGHAIMECAGSTGRKWLMNIISSRRLVAGLAAVALLAPFACCFAQSPQERVHHMSHQVMPFDMAKTIHVFRMTETGGVQRVEARNPDDAKQIELIRQHLKMEAERFGRGDYSDPARLHGADMPGLKELEAHPSGVKVAYQDLPAGGQITFETDDLHMLTAIHRWFGAQLSEHGADARAE
ncbi:MAG TPA: hypothetical protein VKA13_03575 [Gammaproteobacteria bacterium]|nr:hypothetical protein [Gammaproteobacteria bacterium]